MKKYVSWYLYSIRVDFYKVEPCKRRTDMLIPICFAEQIRVEWRNNDDGKQHGRIEAPL